MAEIFNFVTQQRPFVMVYYDFLDDKTINPYEFTLFTHLKRYAGAKTYCYPSLDTLAEQAHMSKSKVQKTLTSLESKGYITKQNRYAADGGSQSNLYWVYDPKKDINANSQFADGKNSIADALTGVISDLISIQQNTIADRLKEVLAQVSEQKKAPAATPITTGKDPLKNHIKDCISNIHDADANCQDAISKYNDADANGRQEMAQSGAADVNCHIAEAQSGAAKTGAQDRPGKSRATEYTMAYLRDKYDYHILRADTDINKTQLDYTLQIIYDTLNSTQKTIRVQGQDKPANIVKSQLLGLGYIDIKYVIEKYNQQTSRITNTRGYILSMLYVAKGQQQADVSNRVRADGVI